MKITDVTVDDPRMHGDFSDPEAIIYVDEPVLEIGESIHSSEGAYRAIPCGPFWAIEQNVALDKWETPRPISHHEGIFNKLGLIGVQLISVAVVSPDGPEHSLFMEVTRLRRLIRKHKLAYKWHVIVDEQAALVGLLKWRVELRRPRCYGGAMPNDAVCPQDPTHILVYKDTHLPLCEHHRSQHEGRMRESRLNAK